jgi:hypothetical protein
MIARFLVPAAVAGALLAPRGALAQWQTPAAQPAPYGQPAAQPQQPYAQPQPAPYGGLQAGGLAPPPPMGTTPPNGEVARELDRAKEEDAGRGLTWVWIEVEGGYEHVGLSTFESDEQALTAGFVESTGDGAVVGAGLGVKLLFLTLGARGRAGFFEAFQLMSLGGEVGARIPLGNLEPRFAVGAGWAGLGSLTGTLQGAADAMSVRGYYARASGGLDYFVTPTFSIGASASWELLGLTRPGLGVAEIATLQETSDAASTRATALAAEGSSYGSAIAITGALGLHF